VSRIKTTLLRSGTVLTKQLLEVLEFTREGLIWRGDEPVNRSKTTLLRSGTVLMKQLLEVLEFTQEG
jgi:hypothetical protein